MTVKRLLTICLLAIMTGACSKMHDNYSDFIEGGEIIYTSKPDSVRTFPGNSRIRLTWLLLSDPKITKCKVFWNDGQDFTEIPVQRSAGVDTISVILDNMEERSYAFEIFTYDNEGHSSVKAEATGSVYGPAYINSLYNRPLKNVTFSGGNAILDWYSASAQCMGVELTYTDIDGMEHMVTVSRDSVKTTLPGVVQGESFLYRTLYMPVSTSIDTFYTGYEARLIP